MIARNDCLQKLIDSMNNGMIKVVTRIRRCGKSFIVDPIFKDYLMGKGISENILLK